VANNEIYIYNVVNDLQLTESVIVRETKTKQGPKPRPSQATSLSGVATGLIATVEGNLQYDDLIIPERTLSGSLSGLIGSTLGSLVNTPSGIFGDAAILIPTTISVGDSVVSTYTYNNNLGNLEANPPPSIESCYIDGDLTEGETITFNVTEHTIYNDGVFAPTVFRLYSAADMQQGGETLIYSGTSTTYVLTSSEAGKYLRLEADPKQTGGLNLTGETEYATYVGPIEGTTFNPITSINWNGAYVNTTLSTFSSTSIWPNSKGGYASAIQDGVRALPVYDGAFNALNFTRASSQILAFSKNVGLSYPFETYIRFRVKALSATQYVYAFNNSVYVQITTTGALTIGGSPSAIGLIAPNTWYVLRVYHNGVAGAIELNLSGTEIAMVGSTSTVGSGTSRMGASWSGSAFLDGYISDFFITDTPLTTDEKNELKTWFGL
jgi:hypothetical protein